MWQLWLIILIILLLTLYFYPNTSIFFFSLSACISLIFALFMDNLIITTFSFILTLCFLNSMHIILRAKATHSPISLSHALLHQKGIVLKPPQACFFEPGIMRIHHHIWMISSSTPLHKGQVVKVIEVQGVRLIVSP